ncbi:MAG: aspartate--tRNA(Asn) ligase [Oscillospiraceae bacterium]|nr:aspartate--tRNA(Asn) ligase [Oscillospiraceae bacterium]
MKKISGGQKPYFDPALIGESEGREVTVQACVHRVRKMSGFAFIILRTGRYLLQALWNPDCKNGIDGLRDGCYGEFCGLVRAQPKAPLGHEIVLSGWKALSGASEEFPLKISQRSLGCSLDANLDHRSVALRNPKERAVFHVSQAVESAFRDFMIENKFTEIHSPKIVMAGAEGGATLFGLEYFDRPAYLSQSPQFYKQTGVALFERVFEIGPVFRAEKHNTSRHLNEYIGLDFEMGYIDSMYDIMETETGFINRMLENVARDCAYELDMLCAEIPKPGTIPAVTFVEAMDILKETRPKADLDPDDELKLCKYSQENFGSEFIFVSHFPSAKRPFYTMDDPENPKLALSFDLLFRGLEITTGSQRIHGYQEQIQKCARYNIKPEELGAYLEAHKYGIPPHGGAGIGHERLVMKLLNLPNVRQASLFPRDVNRLDP